MTYGTFFIRFLFTLMNMFFMTAFILNDTELPSFVTYLMGAFYGLAIATLMMFFEKWLKRLHFRLVNLTLIGLALGYFMGLCVTLLFTTLTSNLVTLEEGTIAFCKFSLFLCSAYLGVILSYRYSEEFYLRWPFIQKPEKIRKLLLDGSALADPRIIDLAATGILDQRVMIPRFLLQELQTASQSKDDIKAKRALEHIKKMECMHTLRLVYKENDRLSSNHSTDKFLQLAQLMQADILTADSEKIQNTSLEQVKVISLYELSKALKPLMQSGEYLTIKVQRMGKEEKQGIGYLDDGTMVVVNGAGDFIGGTIEARVLSVKHTQSGRLVFCNLVEAT